MQSWTFIESPLLSPDRLCPISAWTPREIKLLRSPRLLSPVPHLLFLRLRAAFSISASVVIIRVSARGLFTSLSRGSAMYSTYPNLHCSSQKKASWRLIAPFRRCILFFSVYLSIRTAPMQLKLHYVWG